MSSTYIRPSPSSFAVFMLIMSYGWAEAKTQKDFHVSLPFIQIGREAKGAIGYNMGDYGVFSLEVGIMPEEEELGESERKEKPDDSLLTRGQEAKVMLSQYNNTSQMSGFFWAVGLGYRQVDFDWITTQNDLDTGEKSLYQAQAQGPIAETRGGYRYVNEDWGFLAGIYLGIRHFENQIADTNTEADELDYQPIDESSKKNLRERFMTSLIPGIEIGWAF